VTSPWGIIVRVGVGVVGLLVVLGSFIVLPLAGLPALWGVLMGCLLVAAALFDVGRYRTPGTTDRGRFERTDEVFVDPTTGVKTRVWFDPRSGERRYEPES
jgi:hypothetical protein